MGRFYVKASKAAKKKRDDKAPKPFPRKKVLLILSVSIIPVIMLASFYAFCVKSRYFIVQDVVMVGREPDTTINYYDLERMTSGENIFKLSLKDIRKYMLDNYRELRDLRLERAFPNSIIATVILRTPVAQLYRDRYYPIDEDGVILSGVKDFPDKGMPIINGARFNPSGEIGKETESKHAKKALALLKELNASGILDRHTLVEIDVSNLRNTIFFLEDGLEVKIGRENYASRLENLKEVLSDPKLKPSDIRYIDLRFKEPVIGPKWKK